MSARYLGAAGLFLGVLCFLAVVLGGVLPFVAAWQLVLAALVLYPAGVAWNVLPPGRPNAGPAVEPPEPAPVAPDPAETPLVPGPARPAFADWSYVAMDRQPAQRGLLAAAVLAALAAGLAGGTLLTRLTMADNSPAAPASGTLAETPSPTVTATAAGAGPATPTPEPATPTPTATPTETASPTPTATPQPPTPAPTPTPSPRATPATQGPAVAPQSFAPDLSGTWEIVDTVTYGPGAGETTTFDVELEQAGRAVRGAGAGLQLEGERQGNRLLMAFERPGATGFFIWTVVDGNTLQGSFRDNGVENGGTSVARRLD